MTLVKVIGVGAGGHARVVMEALRAMGGCEVVGLLDANPGLWNTRLDGVPVLGADDRLADLLDQGISTAFIGVGVLRDTTARRRLHGLLHRQRFRLARAVHPAAVIATDVEAGEGLAVLARAVVNPGVRLGVNVVVNTGAIVEHDCVVGDHAFIGPGAVLGGGVRVGEGALVGLGACVKPGTVIGANAVVGMGAVVLCDVPDGTTVAGNPARRV